MIMDTANYSKPSSRGFTLVELLIAMVIALIITIGVVQVFSANRATYQIDEALARAQENGRFALEFLAQDIRAAGYLGCRRDVTRGSQVPKSIVNYLMGATTSLSSGISGFEYSAAPGTGIGATFPASAFPMTNATAGWSPALDTALVRGSGGVAGAQPGTDVIAVQHLLTLPLPLVKPYVDSDHVYLDPFYKGGVAVGDVMLISDCSNEAIFQVTDISATGVLSHITGAGTPGNRCAQWQDAPFLGANAANSECTSTFKVTQPNTVVGQLQTVVFYVAQGLGGPACASPGTCQPTLYRVVSGPGGVPGGVPQALVEGVENMQVLYGVDTNSDGVADQYVTANNVGNFSLVTSVRIGLLIHGTNATGSVNDVGLDTATYNVAGTTIDPTDDRLRRRVFSTTLQLRNRGF